MYGLTRDECKLQCLTDPSSTCVSANYEKAKELCLFYRETYAESKENLNLRTSENFTMFSTCSKGNVNQYVVIVYKLLFINMSLRTLYSFLEHQIDLKCFLLIQKVKFV